MPLSEEGAAELRKVALAGKVYSPETGTITMYDSSGNVIAPPLKVREPNEEYEERLKAAVRDAYRKGYDESELRLLITLKYIPENILKKFIEQMLDNRKERLG